MKQHDSNMRSGKSRPGARLGTRAAAAVATFSLVMSMCPGAAALAYANEQLSGGSADMMDAQAFDGRAGVHGAGSRRNQGHSEHPQNVERYL